MEKEKEILGVQECAKFLGLSASAVYMQTRNGEIPHYKPSRKIYFFKDELIEYIKQGRVKTREEIAEDSGNETKK